MTAQPTTRDAPKVPDDGIYTAYGFDEYASWPLLNISTLLWADKTLEHLKAAIDGQVSIESRALNFGRAVHCRLLEPDEYKKRFVVAKPCQAKLKSGTRKGLPCGCTASYLDGETWLCGSHKGDNYIEPSEFISPAEAQDIDRMAVKIGQHPVVNLIRQHGGYESSIVWKFADVRCKGRLDKLITNAQCPDTIVDLKKVRVGHGGPTKFAKSIISYSYHTRAAWYCDAVKSITGRLPVFIWIVVEDGPPYSIAVYRADDYDLSIGRFEYRRFLNYYSRSMISGEWPGYTSDIERIYLPDWYRKQFESFDFGE